MGLKILESIGKTSAFSRNIRLEYLAFYRIRKANVSDLFQNRSSTNSINGI